MAHLLAACSRVLYDKQALDDRAEIERLRRHANALSAQNEALFARYKYLATTSVEGFDWQTDTLLALLLRHGALRTTLERCGVDFVFAEGSAPKTFCSLPYRDCCAVDADVVVASQGNGDPSLLLGRRFWGAANISAQRGVYLFMYALHQLDAYLADDENGGFVYDPVALDFVLDACVAPYVGEKGATVPEGMFPFEAFVHEADFEGRRWTLVD